ncbi:hypothetical protein KUF83_21555 [Streptomyces sp. BV286]|uniref:hypothetical protein n=1 Tax=unclassified Streptomyces TaxID=2593676 RepID=UPI001C2E24E7|nr:hypothetical protein [Streptomyces sp. BV286]MBV1939124.1 hypothetical protein [Streptomyces sp. BV286]
MAPARRSSALPGSGTTTVRLVPQDPEWLHDFYMTHDLLLAPYYAAWSARERGVGEHIAPPWPAGLENLTRLDAPASLDAWSNIHRALPPVLRSRRILHATQDPVRRSGLRAPDGRRLVPLHPVTVDEADLRALTRVRRAIRAGAKASPSILVTRRADGSADIESVASPGDYRGTVDRTVAVLALTPDEDVEALASVLAPEGPEPVDTGTRRVDLSDQEYAAYERFADRLAAAAMTGQFPGDRALFRERY